MKIEDSVIYFNIEYEKIRGDKKFLRFTDIEHIEDGLISLTRSLPNEPFIFKTQIYSYELNSNNLSYDEFRSYKEILEEGEEIELFLDEFNIETVTRYKDFDDYLESIIDEVLGADNQELYIPYDAEIEVILKIEEVN